MSMKSNVTFTKSSATGRVCRARKELLPIWYYAILEKCVQNYFSVQNSFVEVLKSSRLLTARLLTSVLKNCGSVENVLIFPSGLRSKKITAKVWANWWKMLVETWRLGIVTLQTYKITLAWYCEKLKFFMFFFTNSAY